ncbi:MAG: adenylate/guanylate cyclase domain-containing protein [Actinobacteria bacterium]|nr:MAG: adenylate/guanylate cyclase domain-containing protein [Actinomycetota bacterium]
MQVERSLPTGTVSLLCTDIEGSTRLLHTLGERYAEALAEHRRLLRTAFAEHRGCEVDTQGDAFFYAFPRAHDAVAGAVAAQRALAAHVWPEDLAIRVRIGIHTGEPTVTAEGYVGIDVHRVARVMSAGHGGQVLLTQSTRDLLPEELSDAVSLRDLGEHRLKDLTQPQRLYQLVIPGLENDFPALKTLEGRPTNLPIQPTVLIGREQQVKEAVALLRREGIRLVTLTGPGGTGKTRLSLQVAAELVADFEDGVFFVDLAAISDPHLFIATVAQTLAVRERPGQSLSETLKDYLRDKHLLLVLDNFEQLLDAGPAVSALLAAASNLKALVTSRAPLHLSGEHEYSVPPLAVPDLGESEPPSILAAYEAVQLFLARAQAVKPEFELTSENTPAVAEICARLDGLPLAIELGAARVRMLGPQALLGRLSERLALLTEGTRDAPARQRTLRDTIEWSYDLLDSSEQRLFARQSVFLGGATIEAAEAVCEPVDELEGAVFDGIASLVEKSLLRRQDEGRAGESRILMLETIREYALDRLERSGEEALLRQRHANYFVALAEEAEPEILGVDQIAWLERLEDERDNFRAALGWSLERRDTELALRLIGSLRRAWVARGYLSETRTWLEAAFEQSGAVPPQVEAKARYGLGRVALVQGDYDQAIPSLEQSARLFRELAEAEGLVFSLADLSFVATAQGRPADAQRFADEALEEANAAGNDRTIAAALHSLACTKLDADEYGEARALFEQSLALRRKLGDKRNIANSLSYLGSVALLEGDYDSATALLDESVALGRDLGNLLIVSVGLANESLVTLAAGDAGRAAALCIESLALSRELGDKRTSVECLHALAGIAAVQAEPLRTALLSGAAASLHAEIKASPSPAERMVGERFLPIARAAVDDQSFEAAWAEGRQMGYDAAVTYALENSHALRPRE